MAIGYPGTGSRSLSGLRISCQIRRQDCTWCARFRAALSGVQDVRLLAGGGWIGGLQVLALVPRVRPTCRSGVQVPLLRDSSASGASRGAGYSHVRQVSQARRGRVLLHDLRHMVRSWVSSPVAPTGQRLRPRPNQRLKLTAHVDCGMNLSSVRRSLGAPR
jgi:hypothetical protein